MVRPQGASFLSLRFQYFDCGIPQSLWYDLKVLTPGPSSFPVRCFCLHCIASDLLSARLPQSLKAAKRLPEIRAAWTLSLSPCRSSDNRVCSNQKGVQAYAYKFRTCFWDSCARRSSGLQGSSNGFDIDTLPAPSHIDVLTVLFIVPGMLQKCKV